MDGVQDADLWGRLLGLEPPWSVERIELHVREEKIDVYLVHSDGALWPCPECGKKLPSYDHKDERVWRHLKIHELASYAPHDVKELAKELRRAVVRMRARPKLIRSFVAATHLYD